MSSRHVILDINSGVRFQQLKDLTQQVEETAKMSQEVAIRLIDGLNKGNDLELSDSDIRMIKPLLDKTYSVLGESEPNRNYDLLYRYIHIEAFGY